MGSLGEHLAQATHTSASASQSLSKWTPSARRCSPSSLRRTVSTPSSTTLRRRPRSPTGGPTRLTATSGTMARKFTVLRSSLTRPVTSCRRPLSPWRRRRRLSRAPMNNEVTLEELDKNLRASTKMAADNGQKLDELSRKLGVQEDELKRAIERAELAENKLKSIEEELQ